MAAKSLKLRVDMWGVSVGMMNSIGLICSLLNGEGTYSTEKYRLDRLECDEDL